VKNICAVPEMYQVTYANFRGCVIRRFPFSIIYTIEEEGLIVHSVFNNRQDPGKKPK
jgi:toxin ParE1/3/4